MTLILWLVLAVLPKSDCEMTMDVIAGCQRTVLRLSRCEHRSRVVCRLSRLEAVQPYYGP